MWNEPISRLPLGREGKEGAGKETGGRRDGGQDGPEQEAKTGTPVWKCQASLAQRWWGSDWERSSETREEKSTLTDLSEWRWTEHGRNWTESVWERLSHLLACGSHSGFLTVDRRSFLEESIHFPSPSLQSTKRSTFTDPHAPSCHLLPTPTTHLPKNLQELPQIQINTTSVSSPTF